MTEEERSGLDPDALVTMLVENLTSQNEAHSAATAQLLAEISRLSHQSDQHLRTSKELRDEVKKIRVSVWGNGTVEDSVIHRLAKLEEDRTQREKAEEKVRMETEATKAAWRQFLRENWKGIAFVVIVLSLIITNNADKIDRLLPLLVQPPSSEVEQSGEEPVE